MSEISFAGRGRGHLRFDSIRGGWGLNQLWLRHLLDQLWHLLVFIISLPKPVQVQDLSCDFKDLSHVHRKLCKPAFHVLLVHDSGHVDAGQCNEVGGIHQTNITPEHSYADRVSGVFT